MGENLGTTLFGEYLLGLRNRKKLSLREVCSLVQYDPSNWSKIERNQLEPPADEETLNSWASVLGVAPGTDEHRDFFEKAYLAKGRIPKDIFENPQAMEAVPALFRKLRKTKIDE